MTIVAIYSKPENGYAPAKGLTVGAPYVVENVEMGSWMTYITLQNVEGEFNSVQFDYYVDGKQVNIHEFPYCNHRAA
jgi:hypothetical protein